MMIDYHVHTPLCNHADGEMEAYVCKAIANGLKEICFLDHLIFCETGKNLSMTPEQVPLYFQSAVRLREKYRDSIRVKVGLEIDFNPEYDDRIAEVVNAYDFDVLGCAIHFMGDIDVVRYQSGWNRGEGDPDRIYALYFEWLEAMLARDYVDVICHIDLIKKFKRRPTCSFDERMDRILSAIRDKNLAVEINASGYDHPVGEPYPSQKLIEQCVQRGIRLTTGSDAHHPENVGRHFQKVYALLRSAGCKYLTSFSGRRAGRIQLEDTGNLEMTGAL